MKPAFDLDSFKRIFSQLVMVQPRQAKITVGLDVGSSTLKILALGAGRSPRSRPVINKLCMDLPAEPSERSSVIRTAYETLNLPVNKVAVGLSGASVIMRVIEMPSMNNEETKQALPFEAERYLPFSMQDVVLDGCVLGPASPKKSWVLVAACKKDYLTDRLTIIREAGLEPAVADVDALALTNSFLSDEEKRDEKSTCALLNIGAEYTNVVVFRGSMPYLVRDIPWGARRLFKELSESLGLTNEQIQKAIEQSELSQEREDALKSYSETLISELQLSFDYFENQFGKPPEEVFVTGGLSQSEIIIKTLKGHLAQDIQPWSPLDGLENRYAIAYGLALRKPA